MASIELRPTFQISLDYEADEAMRRLRTAITKPPFKGRVDSLGRVADFRIPRDQQRLWSPHLSVQVEEGPDQLGLLHARFSPRPEIWTGIMLFYVSVIFLMLCAAVFAYAQWVMETTPWALAMLPAGIGLIAAIHGAAMIGQRLSADQMLELRSLLREALERASESPAVDCPPTTRPGDRGDALAVTADR